MKTIHENLPAIVEAVKPKHMTLPWTLRWADFDGLPRWIYGDDEAGGPGDEVSEHDAYAACVVALLGRMVPCIALYPGPAQSPWNVEADGDAWSAPDPLSALYAAFVARPDLFGGKA